MSSLKPRSSPQSANTSSIRYTQRETKAKFLAPDWGWHRVVVPARQLIYARVDYVLPVRDKNLTTYIWLWKVESFLWLEACLWFHPQSKD